MTALGALVNASQNFLDPGVFPNDIRVSLNLARERKKGDD